MSIEFEDDTKLGDAVNNEEDGNLNTGILRSTNKSMKLKEIWVGQVNANTTRNIIRNSNNAQQRKSVVK